MLRYRERNPLADQIEDFILQELYKQSEPTVVLRRKEIAEKMACAPSQVTYVINTRFSANRQYVVESRRGLNGFIRIAIRPGEPCGEEEINALANRRAKEATAAHRAEMEEQFNQYFSRLSRTGMVTMRECVLMRNLMDVLIAYTPEERWENALEKASQQIARTLKEGK